MHNQYAPCSWILCLSLPQSSILSARIVMPVPSLTLPLLLLIFWVRMVLPSWWLILSLYSIQHEYNQHWFQALEWSYSPPVRESNNTKPSKGHQIIWQGPYLPPLCHFAQKLSSSKKVLPKSLGEGWIPFPSPPSGQCPYLYCLFFLMATLIIQLIVS